MILNPTPYIPIENTFFGDTIIVLRNKDFAGISVQSGKIAIAFQLCFFKKLIIQCGEQIDFDEVSLLFSYCVIEDLIISQINSTNVTVNIHASLISGKIDSEDLRSITLNNCILINNIFLINQRSIFLSYTTENIFPFFWSKLFRKTGVQKYRRLLRQKQSYHVSNPVYLDVRSNNKTEDITGRYLLHWQAKKAYRIGYRLTKAESDSLKIHLDITYGGTLKDTSTLLNNLTLESLSLSGESTGKVNIENVEVANLYLSDFEPQKETVFYNITSRPSLVDESKISVYKCNFDNVWFDSVEFNKFDRLSFFRSKLSKATFTSCSFPDKYQNFEKFLSISNIHYPDKRPANYDKDQYEMLLQLKKAFEATGNYYEGLKLQAISYAALHKVKTISTGDRITLFLNRKSNNYGLSTRTTIFWFFRITIPLYLLYLWSLGMLFQPTGFDPDLIGYYFSFVDLTHWSDFLVSDKKFLNGLALTIDGIDKVTVGYLIYQFVSAFRKYSKNG